MILRTAAARSWILKGFVWLATLLPAQAINASEFSLRLDDVPQSGMAVGVSLFETCTPYECGRASLFSEPPADWSPAQSFELFLDGAGVVRGATPEDRDAWWVVVEPGDSLALALLWRPPVADGYLPPAPSLARTSCRVTVIDDEGAPVPRAHVSPVVEELPAGLQAVRDKRPAVFPGWRPWLRPGRTDGSGRASIEVPAGGSVALHAWAPGYRSDTAPCIPGEATTARLRRASVERFRVVDAQGRTLPGVLARDGLGAPLALSDVEGKIELDPFAVPGGAATTAPAAGTRESLGQIWFETAGGSVYELIRLSTGILVAAERSSLRTGVVLHKADAPAEPAGTFDGTVWSWREANWPWPAVDPRSATPLLRSDGGEYTFSALPGERLWFAADGTGHVACEEPTRRVLGSVTLSDRPCPVFESAPRIEGVVVDEEGVSIRGVELGFAWDARREEATVVRADRPYEGRALARSDSAGRFTIHHVPERRGGIGSLSFSSRHVYIDRPPYLPIRRRLLHHFEGPEAEYRITLLRGARVTGRIMDAETTNPIVGAEVGLGRFGGTRSVVLGPLQVTNGWYGDRVRTTRTDSSGFFEMTAWPGRHDLVARAPGKASLMRRNLQVPAEGLDLGEVGLHAEFEIRGIVRDRDGVPMADATVRAAGSYTTGALDEPRTDVGYSGVGGKFDTDDRGRFRIPGLSEHSLVDLLVAAPGFATEQLLEVPPTESAPVEVALEPEAVIAGRVTFRGHGVAAWLEVFRERGDTGLSTDEEGRFRTRGLAAGRYNLVAHAQDTQVFTNARTGARSVNRLSHGVENARASVDVASGETVEVELELGLGQRSLSGRAVEYGVGLPGVQIQVGVQRTVTGGDGRYFFKGLPSGLTFATASRSGSASAGAESSVQRKTVDIQSKSARLNFDFSIYDVSGRAALGNGSPAASIRISFNRLDDSDPFGPRTTTGADGSFRLRLTPGEYRAGAMLDGRWTTTRSTFRVRGSRSDLRVRFGHSLTIHGTVHGLSESDLDRLQIEAVSSGLDRRGAARPPESPAAFSIGGLDAGLWTVIARVGNAGRRAEKKVRLEDQDAPIDLQFERLPILTGTVLLDGQPLQGTQVLLARGRDLASARRFWTRHDGAFRFPDLEPANYTLGVGAGTRTVSVRSDSDLVIDLRSGRIEGLAFDSGSGAPLAGAAVDAWPSLARRSEAEVLGIVRRTFVDSQGRFALDRLPEGAWNLEVEGVRGTRHIDVGANVVVQVTIR